MNLLLLSNSRNPDSGYLAHALDWLRALYTPGATVAFVPYAAVRFSYDEYERSVAAAFARAELSLRSVHAGDPQEVLAACDGVAIGGGNTFRLLERMQHHGLVDAIRDRVVAGMPYSGWSAGSNVAGPTIRTTNDMPIIEPHSFRAMGLVPFQINPHYLDAHPDRHMGETREERIQEFTTLNPRVPVAGLREGSALRVAGRSVALLGSRTARIFRGSEAPVEASPEDSLDHLLA